MDESKSTRGINLKNLCASVNIVCRIEAMDYNHMEWEMKNSGIFAVAAAIVAVASAAPSMAAVTYDADLVAPGVYYGNGNFNGHFTVNTVNGVEMGLRSHVYQQNATSPVGNLYSFGLGQTISFDWSFNPGQTTLGNVTNQMTITNVGTGANFVFDPSTWFDNAHSASAPGGYQNSFRLSFGFLGLGYNSNTNATYTVNWNFNSTATGAMNDTIVLKQGSGAVPEPASWALMIAGLGVVGASMRRRKTAVSFA